MNDSLDRVAEETLTSLELRLRRIEFVLAGSKDPVGELYANRKSGCENSIQSRLATLEHDLQKLSRKSGTVKELIDLHNNFPEIFKNLPAPLPSSILSPDEKLSTVLSAAASIHSASSRLVSIRDTPVPDAGVSADLVSLLPRIGRVEVVQQTQVREMAELRRRSAALLEQWYLLGVEGVNECFAEWDERTLEVDKSLSRKLRAAEEE